jgi:DNA-binding response OmpR family regulator
MNSYRSQGRRSWGARLNDAVVLIDDSAQVLDTLGQVLREAHCDVHSAVDGMAGLALVRRLRPKVVILDLFLPHMSGYEVMDAIRADSSLAGTFIIVITAMARDEQELLEMGTKADLCLPKPVQPEALVCAVRSINATRDTSPGLRKHL